MAASSSLSVYSDDQQQQQQQPDLEFTSNAERKVASLQAENESLRSELAQLRLVALQVNATTQSGTTAAGVDSRVGGTATTKRLTGGRLRKERVKVAFNLLAVKHAIERLRNTVAEVRSTLDSDHADGLRMLAERRKAIEERVAWERPLVHRIHEGICELVRHGGNQKEAVLANLFSACSWGHTKMSLVQAAGDIVQELQNLVSVAEQQRRAKEVLEVAATHKDRCLERANKALIDMARTCRDVVARFAHMAREVHGMAAAGQEKQKQQQQQQQQRDGGSGAAVSEEISHVRSLLVTRALTVPDLDAFVAASSRKSPGDCTEAIEKFARQLQDAAFASTSLLSSATKAVLEPDTAVVPAGGDDDHNGHEPLLVAQRRKAMQEAEDGEINPGLVKRLRQRWVRSVFQRAILRMRYAKCLQSIHDDFVLVNEERAAEAATAAPPPGAIDAMMEKKKKKRSSRELAHSPSPPAASAAAPTASSALFTRNAPAPPVPLQAHTSSSFSASKDENSTKWSSSSKPPNKTGSLLNDLPPPPSAAGAAPAVSYQDSLKNSNPNATHAAPWTNEDDRRLQLHQKRHQQRNMSMFGKVAGGNNNGSGGSAAGEVIAMMNNNNPERRHNQQLQQTLIFSGQDANNKPPPRRAPGQQPRRAGNPPSSSFLGKMSPLTGPVEISGGGGSGKNMSVVGMTGVLPQRGRRADFSEIERRRSQTLFAPAGAGRHSKNRLTTTVVANSANTARAPPVLGGTHVNDALREFFVLRD